MTFTVTVFEGQAVGLVMPLAENGGEARIRLDGVNQGKIDTYAEGPRQHRIVVWQTPPLAAGEHSITMATEGHPPDRCRCDHDRRRLHGRLATDTPGDGPGRPASFACSR